MQQLFLFEEPPYNKIINVASVPQRSPFRYPGGKTWLVPYVREWLKNLPQKPAKFIEPFCGGAIVGLNVAFDKMAGHILLVELDDQVAAVWETIITKDEGRYLAEKVIRFELTEENLNSVFSAKANSTLDIAFQTILKNRVNRGGILAAGVGRVKEGENGKGLKSRWYPATLKNRILDIGQLKDYLSFIHGDGLEVISQKITEPDAVFFIDPPYTVKGNGKRAGTRLYTHHELDHEKLFSSMSNSRGDFLMTYDNAEDVLELARLHNFDTDVVLMKNTHHNQVKELLIGRNLDWYRRARTYL